MTQDTIPKHSANSCQYLQTAMPNQNIEQVEPNLGGINSTSIVKIPNHIYQGAGNM